jgi:hypothetical protein
VGRFAVVVCGGGGAGIEGLLRLRRLADDRLDVTLLCPDEQLFYRPDAVLESFAAGRVRRYPIELRLPATLPTASPRRGETALHPLHQQFPLHLRDRGDDRVHAAPGRRAGVDAEVEDAERDAPVLQVVGERGEVGGRPAEPRRFDHDQGVAGA